MILEVCKDIEKIDTYKAGGGFLVDIVTNKSCYEVWLYHAIIGVKEFMYGLPRDTTTYEEAKEITETSIVYDNYIEDYKRDYMMD